MSIDLMERLYGAALQTIERFDCEVSLADEFAKKTRA